MWPVRFPCLAAQELVLGCLACLLCQRSCQTKSCAVQVLVQVLWWQAHALLGQVQMLGCLKYLPGLSLTPHPTPGGGSVCQRMLLEC